MSRLPEPRRLLSRSPKDSPLRLALNAARSREPRAAELQALEKSLLSVIAGQLGEPSALGTRPAAPRLDAAGTLTGSQSGSPLVAKVGALVVTLGLVMGGVWWSLGDTPPRKLAPGPASTELPTPAPSEPSAQGVRSDSTAVPSKPAAPVQASRTDCAHPPCAQKLLAPLPRHRAAPPGPDAAPSASAANAALSELQLIDQARAALRNSPTRALALANQHERQFPHGSMAEERDVITISALVAMGQTSRARTLATAFLRENAGSAYARRVEATLSSIP